MTSPTSSQKYLSTRGGSYGFSFEAAVLKGLASDNGLFIPEAIPTPQENWQEDWKDLSFQDLAYNVLSLYISRSEIPAKDLRELVTRSYSTFRHDEITPLNTIVPEANLHVLELFHGPTFAFKDVALQFVGNLFEYFLVRKNKDAGGEGGKKRHHLTVIGATSGDTGSAAIYGLRGKKDVSVFILHPKGRVSPIQEAQMTTVLDKNVHNLSVVGTFDDCQDIVKALFSHPELSKSHNLGAVNSINWARILAQIVYYFHSYFTLLRRLPEGSTPIVRYVVPTGNFGDVLAGYYAKKMGLPIDKLVIATNENDILDRFFRTSRYEKRPVAPEEAEGGITADGTKAHESGVKETLSPAMDILVSSNFERLLWYLAYENETDVATNEDEKCALAGTVLNEWMTSLKNTGTTIVSEQVLATAKRDFTSERVSDTQIVETIRHIFTTPPSAPYILDPHSAVGVGASLRLIKASQAAGESENVHHISLSTAHPAKFNHAVDLALAGVSGGDEVGEYDFEKMVRPREFLGLEAREKRVRVVEKVDVEIVRQVIIEGLQEEGVGM
ncbi:tryptophan synthase beta subunit-like PLP-dependent enzyme [Choiromyces venosus 120613-1]|uniref:threonine synthase n=1 Tax=Choiromyces venosus 120613-1 TaxID=1336337 RepID=A0A3N4JZB7_9PEZI|nr:tryptophan synthase beta subunit-like PLP-dependent enzyme [Choiromyces venosus 120613-1]